MKVLFISSVSATIELDNNELYYAAKSFDVKVNDEVVLRDVKTNVFSLFSLQPNTNYVVSVDGQDDVSFTTEDVTAVYSSENIPNDGEEDVTSLLQDLIDNAIPDSLIEINPGKYLFTSLKLKDNITLWLKEGALLSASINEDDYDEMEGEVPLLALSDVH